MTFSVGVRICSVYVEMIGVRPPGSDLGRDRAVTGGSESGQQIQWPGIRKHVPGSCMHSACRARVISIPALLCVWLVMAQVVFPLLRLMGKVALVVKNRPANAGDIRDVGSIPGSARSPGEGNGTHSSILDWSIPWTEEPRGLQSTGSQRVRHD